MMPSLKSISSTQRRSQRLFLQVPVIVETQLANESQFSENTRTIVVNAHGALVESSTLFEQGHTLILRSVLTNDRQESIVKLVSPGDSGKFNVAVEFTKPNPTFWQITFPPEDWSARHSSQKRVL
ncbi:MAG TPA: hypothetical protein VNI36_08945 [Candidatus Dormibacteraeota bacterium]|nr:hypothetical protein [Candidatus Dormibacteraeota bacterium]